MHVGSVAFRVVVWLAVNPNKELLAKEIAKRFHVASGKAVRQAMTVAIDTGWVVNAAGKVGRGNVIRYAAGPRLLKERGELYE